MGDCRTTHKINIFHHVQGMPVNRRASVEYMQEIMTQHGVSIGIDQFKKSYFDPTIKIPARELGFRIGIIINSIYANR